MFELFRRQPAIKIKMELKGSLSRYAPPAAKDGRFNLEVMPASTVKDVLVKIRVPARYAGLILINGRTGRTSDPLHPGDTVTIFPREMPGCLTPKEKISLYNRQMDVTTRPRLAVTTDDGKLKRKNFYLLNTR
ncbi:hypothetical protein GFC01_00255 [Desulfofundulus thermobenzoicus]|uniref:Ubiquitin Mut7-C domain-containing protein n=1 Tax=Desulfofundulus thermobenzoicus TaxID=29376 RepID=A0A6N7IL95_9FIRM|nr:hypothetical protein [Desulfofundulus thermobenzoicus]MQL50735.1 hypothetical protein [Desulfofundulus thermobenzoicus]